MFRQDRQAARAEFLRICKRYDGKLWLVAVDLGINFRFIKRIVWRESLWHELDLIRAAANTPKVGIEDNLLTKARLMLSSALRDEVQTKELDAMSYRTNVLGMLVQVDPAKAIAKIAAAYAESSTEIEVAALLDCGKTSLSRWVRRLIADGHIEKPFRCGKPRVYSLKGLQKAWAKRRKEK
jgi:hypothetical protein